MTISRMFAAVRAQISSNTRDRSSELDDMVGKQPLKSLALFAKIIDVSDLALDLA